LTLRARRPKATPRNGKVHRLANLTVVGAHWGDEGKGKNVDWL
jgi:hypothetical protein